MKPKDKQLLYSGRFLETSGYASEARSYVLGLNRMGFQVQIIPLAERITQPGLIPDFEEKELGNLMMRVVNPAEAVSLHHQKPDLSFNTGSPVRVIRTTFETDRLPEVWVPILNSFTEVWVPSGFNLITFASSGVKPEKLKLIREGIDTNRFHPQVEPIPLPCRRGFTFLSAFTWQDRKGWDLLLKAYLTEFKPDEDVTLVILVQPFYHSATEIKAQLQKFINERFGSGPGRIPPILLLTEPLPDIAMARLYKACDAFVLPTRGEGWCRPMAEAMACGKPVIGTAWGGNLDYMTESNSYLIEIEGLEEVSNTVDFPHFRGHRWAKPSVEHLRKLLRQVLEHPDEAAARGGKARTWIAEHWDLQHTLLELAAALECFYY